MSQITSQSGQALLPATGWWCWTARAGSWAATRPLANFSEDKIEHGEILRVEEVFEGPYVGRARVALDAALSEGEASENIRARILEADGQSFACEYGINPILGSFRQINGVIFTVRDLDFALFSEEAAEGRRRSPPYPQTGLPGFVREPGRGRLHHQPALAHHQLQPKGQPAHRLQAPRRCWAVFAGTSSARTSASPAAPCAPPWRPG